MKNLRMFSIIMLGTFGIFGCFQCVRAQEGVEIANKYPSKVDLGKYPQVKEFIGKSKRSFGKLNSKAPPETNQFGQLVGIWEAVDTALIKGKWKCCWRGVWAFKYTVDGFGIQDYYVQKKEDFPPPPRAIKRDTNLTLIRVYSPKDKKWNIARISNGGNESGGSNFATFTAIEKDGEIIMSPSTNEGESRVRMIFYNITTNTFRWRLEVSKDNGKTWEKRFLIKGKRLKL